jgi:RNA polymerase sigma factor (sigma-70 family)
LPGDRDLADGELLERFLARREEAAFAILVERHGPMVLSVCRRILGDEHSAEDALQATFLVLVRRARSIRKKESLASWLHGVARRIAAKVRTQTAARRDRERQSTNMPRVEALDELTWQELRGVLDEEIGRLPQQHRAAVVLCYLEGKSYDQAARQLGCPKSSLASRLGRARHLLRRHLVRRGITLSTGVLATALCANAASVPLRALLTLNTVKAATALAAGKAVAGAYVSTRTAELAAETLPVMLGMKAKLAVILLAVALAAGGGSLAARLALADQALPISEDSPQARAEKGNADGPAPETVAVATDLYGDPLPEGVLARLGTVRLRHGDMVTTTGFALDGKLLVSAGGDVFNGFDIRLWDAASGRLLRRLPSRANRFAISPDGKWLLTDERRLFDIASGKELRQFRAPAGHTECVAFSPDGQLAAAGQSGPGQAVFWEADTGKEIHRLKGHADRISSLALSSDGKLAAIASPDNKVVLWNLETEKERRRLHVEKPVQPFPAYQTCVVAFSPAGNMLVSAHGGVVWLWDAGTGKLLHRLETGGESYNSPWGPALFSSDGKLLATAGNDGMIRFFDARTGKELRHWRACQRSLSGVAFAPDGKIVASTGVLDNAIHLWDTATGKEVHSFAGHSGTVAWVRYALDGKRLFSSGRDNRIVEWDLAGARETGRLFGGGHKPGDTAGDGHDLSMDGNTLAVVELVPPTKTSKVSFSIHVRDTALNKERCTVKGLDGMRSLRLAPDGKKVAGNTKDGIDVWDAATGEPLFRIPGERTHGGTVIFSPDAQILAWASDRGGIIHLADAATGKEIRRWPSGQHKTRVLVFAPDGRSVAGADRADVRLWDAATGKVRMAFQAQNWVGSLAFSSSGRILAGGEDQGGLIHLWEVPTGQAIRRITGPQGSVRCLAFAQDGRTLASGGGDTTILLWDLLGIVKNGAKANLPADLDHLWSDLTGDAARAYSAIFTLARTPGQSMPYLRDKLRPVAPADDKQVAALVADLESKDFAVRDQASRMLAKWGEAAEPALRKVLAGNPTLEVRQRIARVLEKRRRDVLRQHRAIEVLELIDTPVARQALASLARTATNPEVVQAAAAAGQRLAARQAGLLPKN